MKLLKNIALVSILAATMVGCSKDVDLDPIDTFPIEKTFETVGDLELATVGTYGTWLGRRPVYLSAVISDEARQGVGAEYRAVGAILYRWEHTSDAQDFRDAENGCAWTNMYAVIDRVNRALAFYDTIKTANAAEAAQKVKLKGEMLALRGFAHFELLRWYAVKYTPDSPGVILMTTYAKDPANWRPARAKSSEVLAQIDADLAEARNLIPADFTDIGRITRTAVIGMQARVAIYTNRWDNAITFANEVIAKQGLTPRASFTGLWTTRTTPTGTEVLWKLNVAAANSGSAVGSMFQDANTAVQFSPAQKLLDSYDQANDIRFAAYFKTAPRNLIAKYGALTGSNTESFLYDIKMMRTAEMYLIKAEAYAEKEDYINGAAPLNDLRKERITGYVNETFADKASLLNAIMNERYKELCFEGHRYFDLKRKNLPIERALTDVQNNTAIQKLDPTNSKYLLPIPQQEIFANRNVSQNKGY
ncbi:RagB/SusD family nutrient uptake outer membrane protein [Paraflavitalea soli]|uniref:RagB/SusD family nutrient uptake outer membrane protein n=1 Tax=Paraflavitalea soli TaxID=2315862 RepID=A0A3B7MZK4_9BACT|nr:RagB/SusD family nutrient uptake outer membrane protein [Paraflavitalea soli]AXY77175.1 RagB/SusD family nutrient uptake outer membrane protein [Paraflavitalea soli]